MAVDGATVRFGGVTALSDVSVSMPAGLVFGVIGPNGAGKTTFIDAISGFERLARGSVTFCGRDITRWPAYRRKRAGLSRTFQNLELFLDLSVEENLLASISSRQTSSWFRDVVDLLGIRSKLHCQITELSHGEQRLVSIARALVDDPKLLILDEPAAGLDASATEYITGLLRRVSLDRAVMIVEHDVALIAELCDVVVVLNLGEVLAIGKPSEVLKSSVVQEVYLGAEEVPLDPEEGGDGEQHAAS